MTRILVCLSLVVLVACGGSSGDSRATSAAPPARPEPVSESLVLPPVPSPYDVLPTAARERLDERFTGDLDGMVTRRLIRAGVTVNRTHYFIDRGTQRGAAYESLMNFEAALNARLKTGPLKLHVAVVPLPRDLLLPALAEGRIDLVVAGLTVTPERRTLVDFSNPTRTNVSEIVVTGPGVPTIASVDDLSNRVVFVRRSSSYYSSLVALNERLQAAGKAPVSIKAAPENLDDDDILEMVNAGLVPMTVVDDYLGDFWRQVFSGLSLHPSVAVRTGGVLAVAVRKNSPKLQTAINAWLQKYGESSAFQNVLRKRYLQSTNFVKNAASEEERRKFEAMLGIFRKYGSRYQIDPVIMAAQGYQESRLDQKAKSHVGAIGVMQLMPATGQEQKVGDIRQTEPNIHAGIKYMRFMVDQYYKDEPMTPLDKWLMTFASYNAGPARIRLLRRETEKRGLDPNVWFGNVERVTSEKIGRETVEYVSNIYKYYIAYTLMLEQREAKQSAAVRMQ
jgi:membrane-bound lytic murein transglycosylase MltF